MTSVAHVLFVLLSLGTASALPPAIPRGISVGTAAGVAIDSAVLSNPDVVMIGLTMPAKQVEATAGVYDFTYLDTEIPRAAAAGKKVTIRFTTGGGFAGNAGAPGNLPNHWGTSMGVDPTSVVATPGVTYAGTQGSDTLCVPVFWDPVYLAKKTALIAAAGARFANNPTVVVIGVAYANFSTDDMVVPHGTAEPDGSYPRSELHRWTDATGSGGAGYTTAKMLTAAATTFDAVARAFPNQWLTTAIAPMGTSLDAAAAAAAGDSDPANYLPRTANQATRSRWPNRLITQRNIAAADMPTAPATGTVWSLMNETNAAGYLTAAQEVWFYYGDTTYRANSGDNCDHDVGCVSPCDPSCQLTYDQLFRRSIDKSHGYARQYLEIYLPDALNLGTAVTYGKSIFTPTNFLSGKAKSPIIRRRI